MANSHTGDARQIEKGVSLSNINSFTAEQEDPRNGYILDAGQLHSDVGMLKTATDGHTILIPQPSDDTNDPLLWSSGKKRTILLLISIIAFLPVRASFWQIQTFG